MSPTCRKEYRAIEVNTENTYSIKRDIYKTVSQKIVMRVTLDINMHNATQ